jgi:hypothetical protein
MRIESAPEDADRAAIEMPARHDISKCPRLVRGPLDLSVRPQTHRARARQKRYDHFRMALSRASTGVRVPQLAQTKCDTELITNRAKCFCGSQSWKLGGARNSVSRSNETKLSAMSQSYHLGPKSPPIRRTIFRIGSQEALATRHEAESEG